MSTPKALFQPLQIGSLTLKNRVGMAAMTRNRSTPTSVPNDLNVEYYRQRAAGGAGLIVAEGTLISPQGCVAANERVSLLRFTSRRSEWPNAPGIWSDAHIDGWSRVTAAVHQEGGKIFSQVRAFPNAFPATLYLRSDSCGILAVSITPTHPNTRNLVMFVPILMTDPVHDDRHSHSASVCAFCDCGARREVWFPAWETWVCDTYACRGPRHTAPCLEASRSQCARSRF